MSHGLRRKVEIHKSTGIYSYVILNCIRGFLCVFLVEQKFVLYRLTKNLEHVVGKLEENFEKTIFVRLTVPTCLPY